MDQAENLRKLAKSKKTGTLPAIITIASGKGGTGKTSFCINFAIALAELDKQVMVIDADFGLSNVDVMLGANPKHHIGDVLSGKVTLAEAACLGNGGIWYVAGTSGIEGLLNIKSNMLDALQKQVAEFETTLDYILFDCGAGVNAQVLKLMSATDESLLVVTPEPTAIVDAFVLMKSLASLETRPPVRFVMNRAETAVEAMSMARNLKGIVRKYLDYEINFLGYVTFDKSVMRSIKQQMPYLVSYPSCQATKDVKRIAEQFASVQPKSSGGLRRLFERIVMRRGG